MRMVDLFAGIGGFSLAAHQFGITTDVFVEKEPYPQKLLAQNFPDVPIVDDIFNFNSTVYEELTGHTTTDIVSGGFPCQPFSLAGQRKGTEDNRYLWGEMCRVIQELKPRWVIAENVYGIVNIQEGLVFETVHTDLEAQGFEVQSFIIPASSKNAPHRRDRVWFVAHSDKNSESVKPINEQKRMDATNSSSIGCDNGSDNRKGRQVYKDKQRNAKKDKQERREWELRTSKDNKPDVTNTNGEGLSQSRRQDGIGTEWEIHQDKRKGRDEVGSESARCDNNVTNSNEIELQGRKDKRENDRESRITKESTGPLCDTWEEFPTQSPVCGRNDGISNRVDRIKALGNAIVPQVAMEIFKTITEVENANIRV